MVSKAHGFLVILGVLLVAGILGGLFSIFDPPNLNFDDLQHIPLHWKLTWSDEFEGDAIDPKKWAHQVGNGYTTKSGEYVPGWGNKELEFYTASKQNSFVKDGHLHIVAIKEITEGFGYTSARLHTKGLFSQVYGRFEIRAKLPQGRGLWPAIWLLPENDEYGGWAASGEIDIMEAKGQNPFNVFGTLHFGGSWPDNLHTGSEFLFPEGQSISQFHTYAIEWDEKVIKWFVDDTNYLTITDWYSLMRENPNNQVKGAPSLRTSKPAPFDKPFHILLNLAVGGDFLGSPDDQTRFPSEMLVDFVRVYSK